MAESSSPNAKLAAPAWVHRRWCTIVAFGLLALGLVSNIIFLFHHCPFDLTEDESHYWQWSQHLAWGYYTKGPGIAFIIHLAVLVGRWFGVAHATMPEIRTPAVIFSSISGWASLLLARRIFRDDRAGLMVIVLSAAMPVFAVGSLLITIDSPMYCCWALAVLCTWLAVEPRAEEWSQTADWSQARAGWLYAAGVLAGLGNLCKPILIALPPSIAIAAWCSPYLRKKLSTWHSAGAVLVAAAIQIPTLVWNADHHWVMFRAIGGEGGIHGGTVHILARLEGAPMRVLSFIGSEAGITAGFMFVFLVMAVVVGWKRARTLPPVAAAGWIFLLGVALPIFGFYTLLSLWNKVQANWPAAGFFAAMVLLAGQASEEWNKNGGRPSAYRKWLVAAVIWGFLLILAAENMQRVYPQLARLLPHTPARRWDPAFRLRNMRARAAAIEKVRVALTRGHRHPPLIIATRWDTASSLHFYLPGRPFVFCIQSRVGGKGSQFDLWPGLNQKNPRTGQLRFLGRNAVLTGILGQATVNKVLAPAFARIAPVQVIQLYFRGVPTEKIFVRRCYHFRGFPPASRPR